MFMLFDKKYRYERHNHCVIEYYASVLLLGIFYRYWIGGLFNEVVVMEHLGITLRLRASYILYYGVLLLSAFVADRLIGVRRSLGNEIIVATVPYAVINILQHIDVRGVIVFLIINIILFTVIGLSIRKNRYFKQYIKNKKFGKVVGLVVGHVFNFNASIIHWMFTIFIFTNVLIPNIVEFTTRYGEVVEVEEFSEEGEDLFEVYKDELYNLKPSVYYDLPMNKKIEALNAVLRTQFDYLGVSYPIQIVVTKYDDDGYGKKLGDFLPNKLIIRISEDIVNSDVEKSIYVLLHEGYHVYQKEVSDTFRLLEGQGGLNNCNTELYTITQMKSWSDNFKSYVNGGGTKEQFDIYKSQALERDAEEFAEEYTPAYIYIIESL
ncbi:MAG: hypothetical protein IJB96_11055 [Lachnospira sp.]|nr:hypothetical protein [Lachnospira sp.]